ncbi:hypothetical protein [Mesorhizobium retamae]|uniref:Uncharacterized protein n=1 Tax=Mesorhizobium retamae TaxID=2912854 RepID=A0ABS9QK80_9HYPH|nr:hypothetical protein [Mesorhizobium sp. IRAMC:0171]MCG7507029.1 hypothetical protein [Mesorhizobium sp. IRAMC:0171]
MNLPRDAYPGYSEDVTRRPRVNWKHAYIGMEAAWKKSEEVIDNLIALLGECREAMPYDSPVWSVSDDEYRDLQQRVDAALALARGEK